MKRNIVIGFAVTALAAAGFVVTHRMRAPAGPALQPVTRGPLAVWSVYPGKIEARRVETIMSEFDGSATIVELAAEGTRVKKGDLLVRFDDSQVQRDLVQLQRDFELTQAECESLEKAELPLEMAELEDQVKQADADCEEERLYLADMKKLRDEDLVSPQEVHKQEQKVAQLEAKRAQLEQRKDLTRDYEQPSKLKRAKARLAAAEQQLKLARKQKDNGAVYAPCEGVVVYKPIAVGGEFRNARVGDVVYKNQPFMSIPDMHRTVVDGYVPESELALVAVDGEATVVPIAFPGMELAGSVESLGAVAETRPGGKPWQKFFHVTIGLNEMNERLRPGMSVTAYILSYETNDAVLLPRVAVSWDGKTPTCRVVTERAVETRDLKLGHADETRFEVLDGVKPGEQVEVD